MSDNQSFQNFHHYRCQGHQSVVCDIILAFFRTGMITDALKRPRTAEFERCVEDGVDKRELVSAVPQCGGVHAISVCCFPAALMSE